MTWDFGISNLAHPPLLASVRKNVSWLPSREYFNELDEELAGAEECPVTGSIFLDGPLVTAAKSISFKFSSILS